MDTELLVKVKELSEILRRNIRISESGICYWNINADLKGVLKLAEEIAEESDNWD